MTAEIPSPAMSPPPPAAGAETGDRSSVARNAFWLLAGQIATMLLGVVLSAALGRKLGAEDFGRLFAFLKAATFALVLVEWGQGQFLVREVARHPERMAGMLGTALGLRLGGSAVAAGLTALIYHLLGMGAQDCALAALMVVTTVPFFLSQAYGATFRGRERMEYDALVSILNKALTLGLTMAALLLGGGLTWAILAQAGAGVGALALAVVLGRRIGVRARRFTMETARFLVVGGSPIVAMSLAIAAQDYIDSLVLKSLMPAVVVGWYGAANRITGLIVAPANILGSANFPRLSRAAHDPVQLRAEIRAAMRPVLLLGALAGVGTYLFAETAIRIIYGPEYEPATLILQVFAPGLFLLFIDILFGSIIVAAGRAAQLAVAKVINVATTTTLDFLLVPWFQAHYGNGGIGVVAAFGLSEVIMFSAALVVVPRAALSKELLWDFGKALLAAAGALLVVVLVPHPTSITGSLAILVAAVAVFGGLAYLVGLVRPRDLQALLGVFRRGGSPS